MVFDSFRNRFLGMIGDGRFGGDDGGDDGDDDGGDDDGDDDDGGHDDDGGDGGGGDGDGGGGDFLFSSGANCTHNMESSHLRASFLQLWKTLSMSLIHRLLFTFASGLGDSVASAIVDGAKFCELDSPRIILNFFSNPAAGFASEPQEPAALVSEPKDSG